MSSNVPASVAVRIGQTIDRRRQELGLSVLALSKAALMVNSTLDRKLATGQFLPSELALVAAALDTTITDLVREAEQAA